MTFFVTKSLAVGPIRFGVTPRRLLEDIDHDPSFSTGPDGSFIRRRQASFFFSDARHVSATPQLPPVKSINSVPFWESLKPDGTPQRWGFLGLMGLGLLLVLIGFSVVLSKGAQGWVEVILGLAMIATPIVLTAQQRRSIREREEQERAEREARMKHHQELLTAYGQALERMRDNPDEESFEAVARERTAIDLPYHFWAPAARNAILQIGFNALHRVGPEKANEVARLITRASDAAGVLEHDERELRAGIYRTFLWHLLADDRLGDAQLAQLEILRNGLGVSEEEPAVEQFQRLRGITTRTLPTAECNVKLGFHEHCIHAAKGLFLTNKRLLLTSQKPSEIGLPKIDDIEVDADEGVMVIRAAALKKPVKLTVDDPIYTASLIDLASMLNERPRGFA